MQSGEESEDIEIGTLSFSVTELQLTWHVVSIMLAPTSAH